MCREGKFKLWFREEVVLRMLLDFQVEVWLNRLTDIMRLSIQNTLHDAIYAYEEKPRDKWVRDWPAQPALVTTQIWWTTEVTQAFSHLEEGNFIKLLLDALNHQLYSRF